MWRFLLFALLCHVAVSCTPADNDFSNGGSGGGGSVTPPATTEPAPSATPEAISTTPAFPGAEGGGAFTTGGRGGKTLFVTKTSDDGSQGTLRWALNQNFPRLVLFAVSGIIELQSPLRIIYPNLTIAGQSAPGDGICIKNYSTEIKADNIIIRFVRFRMGDEAQSADDAIWGRNQSNIILDHCSMSWSTDECSSFYDNNNFTMQWCMLAESLRNSVHGKGQHGYGGIWGGQKATFHHNLLACHDSRNPRMCGTRYTLSDPNELVDFRNNVIFNWGANSGYAGEGGKYNIVNNYYRPGPASSNTGRIFQPNADDGSNSQPLGVWGQFYVAGNHMVNVDGTPNTTVNDNNWEGIHPKPTTKDKSELMSLVEFVAPAVTTHSAVEAMQRVRATAGASLKPDAVDLRVMSNVAQMGPITFTYANPMANTNGLIDTQLEVGGWPSYLSLPSLEDSDADGMADQWEVVNGLDKNKASDSYGRTLDGRYTNLEVYLNSLVKTITDSER